ncbi:diguanylate cyclase domain-containing protein [Faecalicatena contorta]|uniref:Diguanylate cyclase (GGDEF) domain-containing protein n=1 Tax=Faecalicatena contorta TaxID=39482 RepID=A0A315ZYL5_9FIRM|nr:diguanylate cyclase [Faecalicatena contorta]PWJ50751.1 diguanylate cyclase (GGDEF)-like protein [Faecalicatena contorta]SUQ13319.1 diguanylate cyclase (GGDEF) domain-containing protein [Faecalicatena contorta]
MDSVAEHLLNYVKNAIYGPEQAELDLRKMPDEFQDFGKVLIHFIECIAENAELAKAMSKGNLDVKLPPPENGMAAPLKDLHASLKHLTWQAQQVAKGDYQQRVDFMGDFAEAFNTMVKHLDQQRLTLLDEISNLMQNKSLYETLAGQIAQWIIVTDAGTGERLFISREIEDALLGKDCEAELYQWLKKQAKVMKGRDEVYITELELSGNDGMQYYYSVSIHHLHWNHHKAFAFVLTDISLEREQLRKLQDIADLDTLTQCYNRRRGMEILDCWLAENKNFILCFADIDNLKYVNDRFGHMEGDKYIIHVSNKMSEFSPDAVICRIGGDEFMLLAENWRADTAKERLEVLRSQMNGRNGGTNTFYEYERSISYGVIQVEPDNTLQAGELLSAADEKMYEYKAACS